MKKQTVVSNALLLTAASIWGFAFVAQRVGAEHLGPFAFNGIRFALGGLSLIPLILFLDRKSGIRNIPGKLKKALPAGLICGLVLFTAASLQQVGMAHTTAGKAAFITSLYIIIVPFMGLFLRRSIRFSTWVGAGISVIGLYLLSVNEQFSISTGDILQLVGAFFWALHILVIGHFTRKLDGLKLSIIQVAVCSLLSLAVALFFEGIPVSGVRQALIPILYGGLASVGIAYTLQIMGQKHAKESHAAILLSMENVFAALGGFLILGENPGLRGGIGCSLMFVGLILSQVEWKHFLILPPFRSLDESIAKDRQRNDKGQHQ
jgi:drug/metabolite transporter (DMT)-like permease